MTGTFTNKLDDPALSQRTDYAKQSKCHGEKEQDVRAQNVPKSALIVYGGTLRWNVRHKVAQKTFAKFLRAAGNWIRIQRKFEKNGEKYYLLRQYKLAAHE